MADEGLTQQTRPSSNSQTEVEVLKEERGAKAKECAARKKDTIKCKVKETALSANGEVMQNTTDEN